MDAISCLAPLLPATSFADATSSSSVTSHHHYSPLLCAADQFASYAPAAPPVTFDSMLVAADYSSPTPGGCGGGGGGRRLAPAGARAGKRRSRASKRAPTTYISTDPSNFRFMVQQITGVQAEPTVSSLLAADMTAFDDATVLMAADTNASHLMTAGDHHHDEQQQQQPCFPTLDSWNVTSMDQSNNGLLGTRQFSHYCT